jgi:hemoglobin-like flavoprotein
MDAKQASVILSETFEVLYQDQDGFARSVYDLFFAGAPDAKILFAHTNWEQQRKMLMGALMLMVKNLDNPSLFKLTMTNLAERHTRYGVKVQHFPPFSQAVLQSVQNQLGSKWREEVKESWHFAFRQIEQLMSDKIAHCQS